MNDWRATLWAAAAMAGPAAAAGAGADCGAALQGPARHTAMSGDVQLVFAPRPWPIIVGRHFAVELAVCAPAPAPRLLRVDAEMPAHRHGMNYRSSIKAQADGNYLAEGLMFHMPGQWRLIFELGAGAGTQQPTQQPARQAAQQPMQQALQQPPQQARQQPAQRLTHDIEVD